MDVIDYHKITSGQYLTENKILSLLMKWSQTVSICKQTYFFMPRMETDRLKMMKTHCRWFSASEQKCWSPFFQILLPLYIKNTDEENCIIHLLKVKSNLQVPAPYINHAFPNLMLGTFLNTLCPRLHLLERTFHW